VQVAGAGAGCVVLTDCPPSFQINVTRPLTTTQPANLLTDTMSLPLLQIVRGGVQYALADPSRLDFLAYGLQAFSSKLAPEDAEVLVGEVRGGFRQLLRKAGEEEEGEGQAGDKYQSLHVYLRGLEVGGCTMMHHDAPLNKP
jgi:hypothetical protein